MAHNLTDAAPVTAVDLHSRVAAELDDWDRGEYELDVTVDGCRLTVADDGFAVHVEHISTSRPGCGFGSAMLSAVTGWADRTRVTVRLHASAEFGTDLTVLRRFYSRHGFVSVNRIGGMVRQPVSEEN
jgi:GNAT superfamily N-acetyltransferase